MNISIAILNRVCQIKNFQPLEKGQFRTTCTTDGDLYKHVGRYSTIPGEYVNDGNCHPERQRRISVTPCPRLFGREERSLTPSRCPSGERVELGSRD
jgi:hypothetical protein